MAAIDSGVGCGKILMQLQKQVVEIGRLSWKSAKVHAVSASRVSNTSKVSTTFLVDGVSRCGAGHPWVYRQKGEPSQKK